MLAVALVEDIWKKNFRLSRAEFDQICNELKPYISPNILSLNHRALPVEKKVAAVLYFLKDTGSMIMTANTFGIHQCTLSKGVKEVCSVIVTYMVPKLIKIPNSEDEMLSKISEFEAKFGMTQAFGCIDGTHIPVKAPTANSQFITTTNNSIHWMFKGFATAKTTLWTLTVDGLVAVMMPKSMRIQV